MMLNDLAFADREAESRGKRLTEIVLDGQVAEILAAPVNSPLNESQIKAIDDLISKREKELSA